VHDPQAQVVSGLRFTLAALTLSPFLKDMKRELLKDSVFMSLFIAAGYIGQSLSLQTIEAGKAGFICSLSVIVCPILETVFDNKRVSAGLIAAVILSVSGVATLELTGVCCLRVCLCACVHTPTHTCTHHTRTHHTRTHHTRTRTHAQREREKHTHTQHVHRYPLINTNTYSYVKGTPTCIPIYR
jgi:hypothetical protein